MELDVLTTYLLALVPSGIAIILSIVADIVVKVVVKKMHDKVGAKLEGEQDAINQVILANAELVRENARLKREMTNFMRHERGIGELDESEQQK